MDRPAFVLAVLLAVLALAGPAHAAFPGENGRIAYSGWTAHDPPYSGTYDIYTINPDATDRRQLTAHSDQDSSPSWSADGRRIVYVRANIVHVIDADGSNDEHVSQGANENSPAWSPDGTRIVYSAVWGWPDGDGRPDLFVMNDDGSQATRLFTNYVQDSHPSWSPDGSRIAFDRPQAGIYTWDGRQTSLVTALDSANGANWSPDGSRLAFAAWDGDGEIYTISADGTDLRKLTDNSSSEGMPAWSPDGTGIVYTTGGGELRVMNSDGSDDRNITNTPGVWETQPSWQPLPIETESYVRPKGASPVVVPLVPAFHECAAPTLVHGPPLAHGACEFEASSHTLTVGTPDANGAPAQSLGSVRLTVIPGSRIMPPDDTDVKVTGFVSDVRCRSQDVLCGDPNSSGGRDYVGGALLQVGLRLTDRRNGSSGRESATMVDSSLDFPLECFESYSAGVGSFCQVDSSVNAVAPGLAQRGTRTVIGLAAVDVYDGGPDGVAATVADNEPFLTQGIFIP